MSLVIKKLKDVLDQTGIGNNVEFLRMMAKVGNAVGDDTMVFGKETGDVPKTAESVLYPDMK